MPYFAQTRRRLWKLFVIILIIATLLHGSTFKFVLGSLVNFHIFLHVAFDTTRYIIATHFPVVAVWIDRAYHPVHQLVLAHYGLITRVLAPTLRWMLGYLLRYTTFWIRESPRYLCKVNT
jgi:hypothetical protein